MQISYIENEIRLKPVLELCHNILGHHLKEIDYCTYDAWKARIPDYSRLLIYAHTDGKIIAAVLGRPENADNLVMGFVACDKNFRMRGITESLIRQFKINAINLNFSRITLGADNK